jgi:hypothetical protein
MLGIMSISKIVYVISVLDGKKFYSIGGSLQERVDQSQHSRSQMAH